MSAVLRAGLAAALLLLASACAAPVRPPAPTAPAAPEAPAPSAPPAPSGPATARDAGVALAAPLPMSDPDNAAAALAAFVRSCPGLTKRPDRSGLADPADWVQACTAAAGWTGSAAGFFQAYLTPVRVGNGQAFATGYYEPEIAGSRTPVPGYAVPIYRRPSDLVEIRLGDFLPDLAGRTIRGRVDGGRVVQYYDRAAIEDGALAGKGLEIAWAADPVELFFLQIQGSGQLRLPDGGIMRIGYDGQNGREYVGVGRVLRDRGVLPPGGASMDGIIGWIRQNPAEGRGLMRQNKSYVFFRELTGPGPVGAMGVAVTPRVSVAADPAFVPLGAPVWLALEGRETRPGLWVAQDTGGAIKGANRFDTFWGAGPEARTTAGGMSRRGTAYILLPRAAVARLTGGPAT